MDAAVLHAYGTPQFGTFDDPVPRSGTQIVTITAAAISRFDLSFASGQHYLRPSQLPSVAGHEGVGRLANGQRVYFAAPVSPYGSMAQQTLVASHGLIEVPDGVDDAVAAALGNAGLAAWLPLEWRAQLVPAKPSWCWGPQGLLANLRYRPLKHLGPGESSLLAAMKTCCVASRNWVLMPPSILKRATIWQLRTVMQHRGIFT